MLQPYISTCIHITSLNLTSHIVLYFYSYNPTPKPDYSCSTSSRDYFKVTCCHIYQPQPIEHVRGKHAAVHTPQRQVEFPYTNIVCIVPRLPNSSTNNWGGQSIWTHPYWPQPALSHRQHSPTRATTQGFLVFIHHPEPQLKRCYSEPQLKEYHVLNPYLEPQPKGYVLSHNSRNISNPTFKASLKAL